MTEIEVARMIKLLRKNMVEFTWSPVDMPRLDPSVVVHRLNLDPNAKKIVQKQRIFVSERQKAIVEEVEK